MFRRAGLAAFIGLILSTSAVAASNQSVNMQGSAFSPKTVTVSRSNSVTWTNLDHFNHSATADGDSSLFNTGVFSTGSRAVTFTQAGGFAYTCLIHDFMHGKVKVKMGVSPASAAKGATFTFGLATAATPSGYTHDIQVSRNGGAFVSRPSTTAQTATYAPTLTGTYKVRTRLHRLSNNATTGWSPAATFTVN